MINPIAREIIKIFNVNKFIETGILEGDTAKTVSSWFNELSVPDYKIYEIDIDKNSVDYVNSWKQSNGNVEAICKNSVEFLKESVENGLFKDENDSWFIYLDAHNGSDKSVLQGELSYLQSLNKNIIVSIDDWHVDDSTRKKLDWVSYDIYNLNDIKNYIQDKTDVIYDTLKSNIHSKMSCFIFYGYKFQQLNNILKHLPINPVMI
jgi:hypothetical protein